MSYNNKKNVRYKIQKLFYFCEKPVSNQLKPIMCDVDCQLCDSVTKRENVKNGKMPNNRKKNVKSSSIKARKP